ncbi:hypothetical protein KUCAC02_033273, partial [Chaenocephalus aceratus]
VWMDMEGGDASSHQTLWCFGEKLYVTSFLLLYTTSFSVYTSGTLWPASREVDISGGLVKRAQGVQTA